jgi:oligosaccharide repeat unit polymerase
LGQIAAFGTWFGHYLQEGGDKSLGGITFAGPFDALHLKERNQGIYTESIAIGESETNVYTIYRGLVEDFGIAGALVFQFIMGCLASHFYAGLSRFNRWSIPALSCYYAFYLFYLASIFSYNAIILTLAIATCFWLWLVRRAKNIVQPSGVELLPNRMQA